MTMGSLFSGSGAFELAAILSGITPKFNSEVSPFPLRVTTKRFPEVKALGDVCKIDGSKVDPVDIISFGSPCQDLSIAGLRKGLEGERSGLFRQALRIVSEMRKATNNKYPRYLVWENVLGAFTSNDGSDFHAVLQEITNAANGKMKIPKAKWLGAGCVIGDKFSIAWRTFDSQYWGVPQRRKRIYLVADLNGTTAEDILFKSDGMPWKTPDNFRNTEIQENECKSILVENHPADSRVRMIEDGICQALTQRMGTGGGNVPLVLNPDLPTLPQTYSMKFSSLGSKVVRSYCYQTDVANTLMTDIPTPGGNNGGICVLEGNGSRPSHKGDGYKESDVMYTLNTVEVNAVAYKDYEYIVRRLTPVECARLQGMPDWWCDDLGTDNPTDEELDWWRDIFSNWSMINEGTGKPKTDEQLRKWLKDPYNDMEAYKMWGNGVTLPVAFHVLSSIKLVHDGKK